VLTLRRFFATPFATHQLEHLVAAAVTEFFFSCLVPTVFLPSWLAAKAEPPPMKMTVTVPSGAAAFRRSGCSSSTKERTRSIEL
jgi:hypothetical protein